jgi:hypothetical protein
MKMTDHTSNQTSRTTNYLAAFCLRSIIGVAVIISMMMVYALFVHVSPARADEPVGYWFIGSHTAESAGNGVAFV